jgi:hypothetical protein
LRVGLDRWFRVNVIACIALLQFREKKLG